MRIIQGHALRVLRSLAAESVHCCVTSPPYWGLRDYGTAKWKGGSASCTHNQARRNHGADKQGTSTGTSRDNFAGYSTCRKCGARRVDEQLGLERTPEEYVARLVEVFREVRRVLRDDGTLWLNLGDSYAGSWGAQSRGGPASAKSTLQGGKCTYLSKIQIAAAPKRTLTGSLRADSGLKPKDLVGIPWRVAFALQAAGWYLRSDIIWAKPNPMPESVTDRPTKAHEHLFLLAKRARYYYDAEAVKEPAAGGEERPRFSGCGAKMSGDFNRRDRKRHDMTRQSSRNRRTVWTVSSRPFKGAHFATFPPALIEPCILAGSPRGGTVLDPFAGAGTTGLVAEQHGRAFLGIELKPAYCAMARERIAAGAPKARKAAA